MDMAVHCLLPRRPPTNNNAASPRWTINRTTEADFEETLLTDHRVSRHPTPYPPAPPTGLVHGLAWPADSAQAPAVEAVDEPAASL